MTVQFTLPVPGSLDEAEFSWADEIDDPKVEFLLSLISQKHTFTPSQWPVFAHSPVNNIPVIPKQGKGCAVGTPSGQIRKPLHAPFPRKPFTRSAQKKTQVKVNPPTPLNKTTANLQSKPTSSAKSASSSNFVTHSELAVLKEWIIQQNDLLRTNMKSDIEKLLGLKSSTAADHASQHPMTRTSVDVEKDVEPQSRKRKRDEVEVISSSSSTSSSHDSLRTQTGATNLQEACSPKSPVIDDR